MITSTAPCRSRLFLRATLLGAALASMLAAPATFGATQVWVSGGNLDLAPSWNAGSGPVPTSTDIAQFGTAGTVGNFTSAINFGEIQLTSAQTAGLTLGNGLGNALTLTGVSGVGIDMSSSGASLTLSSPLILGGAQTWNIGTGRTLSITGTSLNAGANLLTVTGAGSTSIAGSAVISSTAGITKTGSGSLTITGLTTANSNSIGTSTLTVDGGVATLVAPTSGTANVLNNTANLAVGGGAFVYSYAVSGSNQTLNALTITPGESPVYASRNGSFNAGLTIAGTVTRSIGGTITARTLDTGRGSTFFSSMGTTALVTSNGSPYMTTGNVYSGSSDNFNDWAAINGSHQVIAASYTSTTANSLGTSAQNANVAGVLTTTLAAAATDASFRDNVNADSTIDLHGNTWQTGGILVTGNMTTAGSSIKDSVGGGSLTGPASSDLVLMISANTTTPVPFTISANIVDNTSTAITKGAPGTLILSGCNTFSGGVYINDGTIQLGSAGALNASGANGINFDSSGLVSSIAGTSIGTAATNATLVLGGNNAKVAFISTANNLSGSTPVIKNANGSSVANAVLNVSLANAATTTFSGTVQDGSGGGTLGLTVSSSSGSGGTLTLAGTNTFTGPTTVTGGTLVVSGNINASGALSVSNGATLNVSNAGLTRSASQTIVGAGTILGNVTNTGTITPGDAGAFGTLTVGNLTVNSGSTESFQFGGGNSSIAVSGLLNFTGSTSVNFFNGGSTQFGNGQSGNTYNLFSFGSDTGFTPSILTWANEPNGLTATFSVVGSDVQVLIGGTVSVTSTWNISGGGSWNSAGSWDAGGIPNSVGGTAIFGAAITGPATVTLDSSPTIGAITFNNSSFGYTIIPGSGGTLTLSNSGNPVPLADSNGNHTLAVPINLSDNLAVSVANTGDTLTISGVLANTSTAKTLTKTGPGTLVLTAANTYGPSAGTVGTHLNAGTINVQNNSALGAGDVSIGGAATVQSGAAGLTLANNFVIGNGLTETVDTNGNTLTLSGAISDTSANGGLTAASTIGGGTLLLTGTNTYGGTTTINPGATVQVGNNGSTGSISTTGAVVDNGVLAFNRSDASTIVVGGAISGSGNLTQNGGSGNILRLNGTNSYSGGTTINSGTIQEGANGAIGSGDLIVAASATLDLNGNSATFGGLSGGGVIDSTSAGAMTLSMGNNNHGGTFSGNINNTSGTVSLAKNGSATLTLSGASSFSGTATVNAGMLELDSGASVPNLTGVTVGGGTLYVHGGSLTSTGTLSLSQFTFKIDSGTSTFSTITTNTGSDGAFLDLTGGSFTASSINLSRTQSYTTAPTAAAPIAAVTVNGLYVNGATANLGTLTIGTPATNSSSSTRLDSGSITATGEILIGDTSNTRWDILQVNGGTFTSSDVTNGIVLSQNNGATPNSSELYLSGGTTFAQKIAFGVATDTIGGTGWLIIGNQTTGSGTLYVGSGGIVQPNTTGYSTNIAFNQGVLGATANWSSSLPMTLSSTSFTIQAADSSSVAHNITLTGGLSGGGALNKTGSGILTLGGTNGYTGATTINAGTLKITGTVGGTSGVNLLGGTLSSAATGTSTLTLPSLSWASGGNVAAVLTSTPTSDLIVVTGALTLSGTGGTYNFDLTGTTLTGAGPWDYTLISYSSETGDATPNFTYTNLTPGYSGIFNLSGAGGAGALTLDVTAVPEPGVYALVLGGVALLAGLRRRKHSRNLTSNLYPHDEALQPHSSRSEIL